MALPLPVSAAEAGMTEIDGTGCAEPPGLYTLQGYSKLTVGGPARRSPAGPGHGPDERRRPVTAQTYEVTGMTCEHCVHAVTEELERLDGVREVTVELVTGGRSAVTVTSEGPLPAAAVAAALDEAGDYRLAGS